MTEAASLERRQELHRRALWLEYFTVGWNVIEGVVAIGAGIIAGSVALAQARTLTGLGDALATAGHPHQAQTTRQQARALLQHDPGAKHVG